ncbi:cyclase/dehydrase [Streptomyces sp. ISL-22]|uniref:cyclase/dehydrase n=1 Tax=unclassified Streptomyces TaxID=2593676 RepID=UPI001BEA7A71|nr:MULTISPECIES: cyclase/dehydrase [unclassified Streptomyces]MBT2418722.1 cyclase/dehydrase [Streptomyces sp. ISL-24]MBT2431347.1 cyclase/dehydrase [Streptomyces sp. ISL-22]
MTETVGSARTTGPLADAAHSEAAERLKAELREYLAVQAQRLLAGAGRKLGETTVRLNDLAEGRSPGLARLALDGGRKLAEGKGPLRSALEVGAARAKENVADALRNLAGGKAKSKSGTGGRPVVVIEYVDVGVPLRTAYDHWTRYEDFSTLAKGADSANSADDRIAWTSEGARGTTKGVVSFHRLGDSLTRVLLVVAYHPKGLFEKTGSLLGTPRRRARLDLKDYVRHLTLGKDARHAVAEEGEEAYEGEEEEEGEAAYAEEADGEYPDEDAVEPETEYADGGSRR